MPSLVGSEMCIRDSLGPLSPISRETRNLWFSLKNKVFGAWRRGSCEPTLRNRALASVLATFLAPGFSGWCSRPSPGHTSGPCRVPPEEFESERSSESHSFSHSGCSWPLRIVLSPQCWPHFWHQASQDRALASVLATFLAPGFSGSCPLHRMNNLWPVRLLKFVIAAWFG